MKVLFLLLSFFLSGLFISCVINDEHGNLNSTSFVACDDSCPVFPGGDAEMMKFIEKNIHYPQDAIEAGFEGKVVVKFTVTKSGLICNISIVESVCKSLDEEAVRIVKSFPKFNPAMRGKEPVDECLTVPFDFKLPSENLDEIYYEPCFHMPVLPGGDAELMRFMKRNVRYPKDALEKGIEGRVITQFTVTKTGSIRNIRIVRSVYKSLDDEAIRVVKSLPKFVPGKIDGALVDIEYTLPVNFRLPSPTKTNH